jgi:hypothetical protein
MPNKEARKKLQDKAVQRRTNKEEDIAQVQKSIETLRELLQGKWPDLLHSLRSTGTDLHNLQVSEKHFTVLKLFQKFQWILQAFFGNLQVTEKHFTVLKLFQKLQ